MQTAGSHILVLEDEPAVLAVVTATLKRAGFQVSTSGSIAGARQCWQAQVGKFDLLLTDFSLPDGSAPKFIQELRRSRPTLRVVLMSGYAGGNWESESELPAEVTYIPKPLSAEELVRVIARELEAAPAG